MLIILPALQHMLIILPALQGKNGLVRPKGDGYWLFENVLFSYIPSSAPSRLQGSSLALAIALPVVFGVLLLVGGGVLAWWWRRKLGDRWVGPAAAQD